MGFVADAFGANTNEVKPVVQAQTIAPPTNITADQGYLQQQQAFAQALQNQMNGQGPSLASTMLQNQAQQNAAQALGMAAANRGSNAGLALRQGLQAGAQGNQQAAQQAATARVQEQLGATGMYGNQINALQQQNLGIQGANQQAAFNAAHANQQAALGASQLNTQIAQGNANNNMGIAGGIIGGIAGAAPTMMSGGMMAHGGMIKGYAGGGPVLPLSLAPVDNSGAQAFARALGAAGTSVGKMANQISKSGSTPMTDQSYQMPEMGNQFAGQAPTLMPGAAAAAPGPSLGMGQLGSGYQLPAQAPNAFGVASRFKQGGKVPGKANVPGDSPKNDTVPIMASPGEIVIPRSHATDPDKAKAFVEQELKKRKGSGKSSGAHQRMMAAHKALGEAIAGMADGGEVELPEAPSDLEIEPMAMPNPQPTGQQPLASPPVMPSMPQPDRSAEPLEIEALPQVTAGMEQGATSQSVAAPQQKPMTLAEELRKYEGQQAGAAMTGAQAEAEKQKNTADALAREAESLRSAQVKYQENFDALTKEHDALIDQYQSGKIDPHRVLGSTGSKIAAAIAIALGGLGQGLSKSGRNMGLDAINKAIDDDINAQKANLGKTSNLLTLNMQRFHNLDQALAVTRMQKQAATQALIGQYAARSGSQQAIAAGQQLAAQIHQAAMPQRQQMAYQQMIAGISQGGEMGGAQVQGLHKEDRERYVQGRGISGLTYDPKDAGPIRESIGTVDAASQSIDQLLDLSKTKGSQWKPNEVVAKAQTLTAMLKGAIRTEIVGPGAVSESEWKLLDDIVANPTKILQMDKNTQKRLETLKDTLDTGLRAKAKARGLSVPASIKEGAPRFGKR
jgi:hypothetical protein